jgi:hypothetical protein
MRSFVKGAELNLLGQQGLPRGPAIRRIEREWLGHVTRTQFQSFVDDILQLLERQNRLALEAYTSHALTAAFRRLLGYETRMHVDAFLKEYEVYDLTAADLEQDRDTLRQLRVREAQS